MPTAVELTRIPPSSEIPYGYCHCGCGEKTRIAKKTGGRNGRKKGEPARFVHNHAHRRSLEDRFWFYVRKDGEMVRDALGQCWRWTGKKNDSGYGLLGSNTVRKVAFIRAHRVSWEIHFGEIPEGMIIRHRCDNPECCNPQHLLIGTHKDNARDAHERGLVPVGSATVMAKLSDDQVREIRAEYKYREVLVRRLVDRSGTVISCATVARKYGVETTTIYQIVNDRSWKHLR